MPGEGGDSFGIGSAAEPFNLSGRRTEAVRPARACGLMANLTL